MKNESFATIGPLKQVVLTQLRKHGHKKRFAQYLKAALMKLINPFQLSNDLFTYTCFELDFERLSIAEYHPKLGIHLYYTNLNTHYKSTFYIDEQGELQKTWCKQRKIPPRGRRKAVYCALEDFYDMHVHLFYFYEDAISLYFNAIATAPEIPWWDEVIQLNTRLPPVIWWRRGKNRLRIAKEETGIYITVYTDTLEILDSKRFIP